VLTWTDKFAGWGGSSDGIHTHPGARVVIAGNHSKIAVRAHELNFPDTQHDLADLSQVDPRRWPTTDFDWSSPSCTHHSNAQGKKRNKQPTIFDSTEADKLAERSRATMWDVVRFAEYHRYRAGIVENVVEVRKWIMWPAWLHAMECLGYDLKVVYLNSMFAQQLGPAAPQSRDRLYVVYWRKGERAPDLDRWTRSIAHCASCDRTGPAIQAWKNPKTRFGKYGHRNQYLYRCASTTCRNAEVVPNIRPAADAIDLTNIGTPIGEPGDRLEVETVEKIRAELARLGDLALVPVGGTWRTKATTLAQPMPTRTTSESDMLAAAPWMVYDYHGRSRLLSEPLPTQTTVERNALIHGSFDIRTALARMLEDYEVQEAMGFARSYQLLGTRKQRFAGLGAAVTPPCSRDLSAAVMEAVTGESIEAPSSELAGVA
jgi:DNA (cytosine-5)-methyltransferase 1